MNRSFIFLFIAFIAASGCNKEASGISNSSYASVSVYAVSPDAPDFNLFLNGTIVAASVPFGSYTSYNRVDTGLVLLHAQSASRNINVDTSFPVSVNQYYSLFLAGNASGIRPVILHDRLTAQPKDTCGLRFFVFAPGVSGIDFHVVIDSGPVTTNGWSNRSYSDDIINDTINNFKKFAAGTYSCYAVSKANNKDTLAKFTNQSFSDSSNYTLMLEGHMSSADTTLKLGTRLHQ